MLQHRFSDRIDVTAGDKIWHGCGDNFSDILIIADVLGCDVNFVRGVGPIIKPVESPKELKGPQEIETKTLPILNAIKKSEANYQKKNLS